MRSCIGQPDDLASSRHCAMLCFFAGLSPFRWHVFPFAFAPTTACPRSQAFECLEQKYARALSNTYIPSFSFRTLYSTFLSFAPFFFSFTLTRLLLLHFSSTSFLFQLCMFSTCCTCPSFLFVPPLSLARSHLCPCAPPLTDSFFFARGGIPAVFDLWYYVSRSFPWRSS